MGGTNPVQATGLRMHLNNGEAHVHDDSKSLKFSAGAQVFKADVEAAMKVLGGTIGMVKVTGNTKTDLCLVRDGSGLTMFLSDGNDQEKALQDFLKGC